MFITQANLSKKSWHYKLLKFSIGENLIPMYNFCPYFWLVITFILFSPIIVPIKSVYLFFKFIIEKFNQFDDYLLTIKRKRVVSKSSDKDILFGYMRWSWSMFDDFDIVDGELEYELKNKNIQSHYDIPRKYEKIFEDWKEEMYLQGKDWVLEFDKIKDLYLANRQKNIDLYKVHYETLQKQRDEWNKKQVEKELKKEEFNKKMKSFFMKSIKYTKWFVYSLLALSIATILYWIGKFIVYVYLNTKISDLLEVFKTFGISILIIGTISLIIFIIIKLAKFIKLPEIQTSEKFDNRANAFFGGIAWPFKKIWSGLSLFWIFFMTWKSNNCPEIIWDDDKDSNSVN